MGAALTYARRYALFALVGIAGEDDLDAPETLSAPSPATPPDRNDSVPSTRKPSRNLHTPALDPATSQQLRDQLLAEIRSLQNGDDLALWAHRRLPAKNTLLADDARIVEASYRQILEAAGHDDLLQPSTVSQAAPETETPPSRPDDLVLRRPTRRRNKAHLAFIASQPCLVCQRSPCDAHHVKFAQPRTLGRKVSDEFTVPLCRDHHIQLHHQGNEAAWWANLKIVPLEKASELWNESLRQQRPPFAEGLTSQFNGAPDERSIPK
jgi:hypothetical protein